MVEKCLAVITARGGSKRIPRKNIKEFCGKPIIAYSIQAALESNVFEEVMVSTDDMEIAEIAKNLGAKVPFMRSQSTSGDMAMTHEVVLEVLHEYEKIGRKFDIACCIYPTAPFLTSKRLIEGKEKLASADAVVPIVRYSFPPQRCFVVNNGLVQYKWPENRLKRSQDLEIFYHDCGQFYFIRVQPFLSQKNMILENTAPIILDEMEVQDIDNLEDWKMAEIKYQLLNGGNEK